MSMICERLLKRKSLCRPRECADINKNHSHDDHTMVCRKWSSNFYNVDVWRILAWEKKGCGVKLCDILFWVHHLFNITLTQLLVLELSLFLIMMTSIIFFVDFGRNLFYCCASDWWKICCLLLFFHLLLFFW